MPDCFAKRCMKFTFRGFSGEMPPLLLTFSEPEVHCSRFWFISSNTDAGGHPVQTGVEEQSLTAEDQLFILMQAAAISDGHARIRSTGGPNLLRARGVLVSFP